MPLITQHTYSSDFRPSISRLHELRALVPSGVPMMTLTATGTYEMWKDIIDWICKGVQPSQHHQIDQTSTLHEHHWKNDLAPVIDDIRHDIKGIVTGSEKWGNLSNFPNFHFKTLLSLEP